MFAFLLFFLDFVAFVFWNGWYLNSVLIYFIVQSLKRDGFEISFNYCYLPILLLVLQDCFLNGRFGLILIFLVPIVFLMAYLREVFDAEQEYICYILVVGILFFEGVLIKKTPIYGLFFTFDFLFEIFINILMTKIILMGVRGNRFLPVFKRPSLSPSQRLWQTGRVKLWRTR